MAEIVTFLWFDGCAEEAARFYVSLFADARIEEITRAGVDNPGGKAGDVIVVTFTLGGRRYAALNGGPGHPFTDAISLQILTEDQAETDRLWEALLSDGGRPVACGWLVDRFGLSWQVTPKALMRLLQDPDPDRARRGMQAMMGMVKIDIAQLERAAAGDQA